MKSAIMQGLKLQKFKENLVSNMVVSRETILTQVYELPLDAFEFLASVAVIEFHTVEAYSSLGRTSVKYNISRLSRVEKE